MKVLVIVPTKGDPLPQSIAAIRAQDFPDFSLLLSSVEPIQIHPDRARNKSLNILRNRIFLRRCALATNAERFLWVDSDTIIPPHTISEFMKLSHDLMGGWYPRKNDPAYVANKFVAENTFYAYQQVQPRIIGVDMLGLGCAMMSRRLLARLDFRGAVDEMCQDVYHRPYYKGQCAAFCEDAKRLGVPALMIPNIVCKHI